MKKLFTYASAIALALVLLPVGSASQANTKPHATSEQVNKMALSNHKTTDTTGRIVLTRSDGVSLIPVNAGDKTYDAIKNMGDVVKNYKTEQGKKLLNKIIKPNEIIVLFKSEYKGSTKKIDIKPSIKKIESDKMLKGDKVVKEKGKKGVGVVTTVTTTNLSKKTSNNVEKLTVAKKPVPEIVLVGTATENELNTDNIASSTYPKESSSCDKVLENKDKVYPNLVKVHDIVCKKFPEINVFWTLTDSCSYGCDHKDGRAIDIMVDGSRGWQVAEYLREIYMKYDIEYIIYEQHIWNPSVKNEWRKMEDRKSRTQNHMDHVHVTLNQNALINNSESKTNNTKD